MRGIVRLAGIGALAALTVSLTGCATTSVPGNATADVAVRSFAEPAGSADRPARGGDGRDVMAVGLTTGGELVRFDTDDPDDTSRIGKVTGLAGDTRLIGIDYRVQDGKLYGVGDKGGVYTLDERRGAATKVRQLTVALQGAAFGVDFNPAANALRVVSDTGQNLRQPFATPDAPTAADTALTNPATPPATGTVAASGVTAVGYTNNDTDAASATTLFDLDTALDRIAVQSPANAGSLAPTGGVPDVKADAGLDVYSTLDRNGRTVDNDAFATVGVGGKRVLWSVDLLTGVATDRGTFNTEVTDLAVPLRQ
jgi:hypothetical protein